MRIPFVAGNWKMNKTVAEARELVSEMSQPLNAVKGVEKVLCPPFTALLSVAALLEGSDIGLGAQNIHWEAKGAFTGEVSPSMVAEFCHYVIIGHSERRAMFGETNDTVNRKIHAALSMNLIPIVCVGETLTEYESHLTADVVARQVREGMKGIRADDAVKLVVAYEPVWAIGSGRASSGQNAEAVIRDMIRPALTALFDESIAQTIRVLYGGSVTGTNAHEFFSQLDIDGALVGGASLKGDDFIRIVNAAAK